MKDLNYPWSLLAEQLSTTKSVTPMNDVLRLHDLNDEGDPQRARQE